MLTLSDKNKRGERMRTELLLSHTLNELNEKQKKVLNEFASVFNGTIKFNQKVRK